MLFKYYFHCSLTPVKRRTYHFKKDNGELKDSFRLEA